MAKSMALRSEMKYKVKGKLGSGERFHRLESTLKAKGAKNPGALAAFIGRKKFGKAKFQSLSMRGKMSM